MEGIFKNFIGYRSDEYSGEGYRDISEVVLWEVENLGNEDIIDTLVDNGSITDSADLPLLISELKKMGYVGAIWICDAPQDVIDCYDVSSQSVYGVIIEDGFLLSDLGIDGKLVAYKLMKEF